MRKIVLASVLTLAIALNAMAQLKTTKISVFKNGSYFLIKEGNMYLKDKTFRMDIPQTALMGTFWVNAGKDTKVKQITMREDTVKKNKGIETMMDMLSASIGKNITLRYLYGDKDKSIREVSGQLLSYNRLNSSIRLKAADGKTIFTTTSQMIEVVSDFNADSYTADSTYRMARVTVDKGLDRTDVSLMVMQTGILWQPSYIFKIMNDKDARLEMKATVENYSEEIENAEINLVVGSPQMHFGLTLDPITNNYLTNAYANNYGGAQNYQFQNMAAPAMMESDMATRGAVINTNQPTYSTEGEKTGDLYFYRAGNIDLPKNSKTIIPLASQNVQYKDVYECDLYDHVNFCNTRSIYNDPNQKFEAYHSVKFTNTTPAPLTTAPVFVVSDKEDPLAQDETKYTPIGGEMSIKLSKAIDVQIKNTEEELSREDNAKKIQKAVFTKVKLKGSIELANFQDKKITLNLSKSVQGTITESGNGKVTKVRDYYNNQNPTSKAKWDIDLAPNEKKTITYEYEVFVQMY